MDNFFHVDGLFSSFSAGVRNSAATASFYNNPLGLNGGIEASLLSPVTAESKMKLALAQTNVDLESARILARQELHQMELQALHLLNLLNTTMQERDEARRLLNSQHHLNSPNLDSISLQPFSTNEIRIEEGSGENGINSSPELLQVMERAVKTRGLPEKGRLVEAVMSAGPLLQMLLIAGPMPQWQHPPPELRCSDIPPVSIGGLDQVKGEVIVTGNEDNLVVLSVDKFLLIKSTENGSRNCGGGDDGYRFNQKGMAYLNAR